MKEVKHTKAEWRVNNNIGLGIALASGTVFALRVRLLAVASEQRKLPPHPVPVAHKLVGEERDHGLEVRAAGHNVQRLPEEGGDEALVEAGRPAHGCETEVGAIRDR